MDDPLRVGLAGFGLGGRAFHAPFIAANPRLRLTHVLQRQSHDAETLYPGVTLVRDFDALLEPAARIDLIVIATPNDTHAPLARRALDARKHVVVDKPFALSAADARMVMALAERNGRIAAPYQNRRWDGDFQTVRALLARGWVGDVRSFESRIDRWRPEIRAGRWKEQPSPGAGLLFDLGPHLVDQALALFGTPQEVSASVRTERPGSLVDDHFEIVMRYAGFAATLGASMMVSTPSPRFVVVGDQGEYVKHGMDPQEEALRAGSRPSGTEWGREPRDRWGTLVATIDGLRVEGTVRTLRGDYGGFYDNLCDAIAGIAPLAVTPADAIRTLEVIERAVQSPDS